jgi:hypothetical protein
MKIHVGTQFHREGLLKTLIHNLEPMGIEWYPVCDSEEIKAFETNNKPWIHPILCKPLQSPPEHACRKLNNFLDGIEIDDNDYYCFLDDDSMYEPGFFDVIRQQTSKIIFCSLSRGDSIPVGAHPHPTYPLIIRGLNDVRVYNIGMCQYIIKGEIAKKVRFRNQNNFDDGIFAENLKRLFPHDCHFLPDLFVFGNYFEPGRYNNNWKIKSHWKGPEII